jgi:hypothetical protein
MAQVGFFPLIAGLINSNSPVEVIWRMLVVKHL